MGLFVLFFLGTCRFVLHGVNFVVSYLKLCVVDICKFSYANFLLRDVKFNNKLHLCYPFVFLHANKLKNA